MGAGFGLTTGLGAGFGLTTGFCSGLGAGLGAGFDLTTGLGAGFGSNITVNVIAPGYIATSMTENLPDAAAAELTNNIPLKRLGAVADVAAAAVYLASEEAGYVTGEVLNVSGGLYI